MKLLPVIYPMGAKNISQEKLDKLWDNPNWIAEIKYDGYRYFCHITDEGNRFTSRNTSVETGRPTEKTDRVPHLRDFKFPEEYYGTILDGEIIAPTNNWNDTNSIMGSLHNRAQEVQAEVGQALFIAFDIVQLKGQRVDSYPQFARRGMLEEFFKNVGLIENGEFTSCFHITQQFKPSMDLFYEVVNQGGEGLVLKNQEATYRLDQNDMKKPANTWVKVKKYDTADVVIMGFENPDYYYQGDYPETWPYHNERGEALTKHAYKGWIGSIKYGLYIKGELKELGSVTGMTEEVRDWATRNMNELLGKVMEIGYMQREKSGSFRHPRILKFRDDKNAEDCKE